TSSRCTRTARFRAEAQAPVGRPCCGAAPSPSRGKSVLPGRIPNHLPEVTVRILEVARVAAPEGLVRGPYDPRAGRGRFRHDGIDLFARADVVAERHLRRTPRPLLETGVVRNAFPGPEREAEAGLQVEEGDGPVFELLADDPFRGKTQPVAIEADGRLEIVDAEGDDGDVGLHRFFLSVAVCRAAVRRHRSGAAPHPCFSVMCFQERVASSRSTSMPTSE